MVYNGKATGGLVQQGFCNSGAKLQSSTAVLRLNFCAKIEELCFDCPTIAKPRNVRRNAPSDRAKFNILTKTDREHNKICKFAEWKTLYQNQ